VSRLRAQPSKRFSRLFVGSLSRSLPLAVLYSVVRFTDLRFFHALIPALKRWGYFTPSAIADEVPLDVWAKRMKRKFFPAILICCSVSPCFSQTPEYPKEIRGYKVERAVVELKPRAPGKVAKTSDQIPVAKTSDPTPNDRSIPSASTTSSTPDPDASVDQLITFGTPSLARVTPLGITLNMPVIVAPIKQSGHVDFLLFDDMTVNEHSIDIAEYRRGFDLPTKKPLTLREPLRFFISLPTAMLAAIGEGIDSKETWPVTGRVYVCGKYKKFVFSFKRCIPVELNLTMSNPLRRK
jgi:hypothetical protein